MKRNEKVYNKIKDTAGSEIADYMTENAPFPLTLRDKIFTTSEWADIVTTLKEHDDI